MYMQHSLRYHRPSFCRDLVDRGRFEQRWQWSLQPKLDRKTKIEGKVSSDGRYWPFCVRTESPRNEEIVQWWLLSKNLRVPVRRSPPSDNVPWAIESRRSRRDACLERKVRTSDQIHRMVVNTTEVEQQMLEWLFTPMDDRGWRHWLFSAVERIER